MLGGRVVMAPTQKAQVRHDTNKAPPEDAELAGIHNAECDEVLTKSKF